jgi:hypothetical protein
MLSSTANGQLQSRHVHKEQYDNTGQDIWEFGYVVCKLSDFYDIPWQANIL